MNQIDQALADISANLRITLTAQEKIVGNHISSSALLSLLNELKNINCIVKPIDSLSEHWIKDPRFLFIALNSDGDTWLLQQSTQCDKEWCLRSFFSVGEVVDEYTGGWQRLRSNFSLCDEVMVLVHSAGDSSLPETDTAPPQENANSKYSKNYVIQHFLNHKRYAWGIIGISVVLALLGVATPLGFQTFADKILPYSAMNSLIVVVALLFLAAIATSVLQCFHDYQESVLFSKYQNGLGKEVFRRLMAMDVPFFDQRKVGDLTSAHPEIRKQLI